MSKSAGIQIGENTKVTLKIVGGVIGGMLTAWAMSLGFSSSYAELRLNVANHEKMDDARIVGIKSDHETLRVEVQNNYHELSKDVAEMKGQLRILVDRSDRWK